MRDYAQETQRRVAFIRHMVESSKTKGIIYANSGGKDCTLVSILCKMACEDTVGVILPCGTKRNYEEDRADALAAAALFGIDTRVVDLTPVRDSLLAALGDETQSTPMMLMNIPPRLRMVTVYAIANSENRLVAGTGNRSETYMGYFTKWGDGAYDFNPISDLTVTEIYEYLRYFNAPANIIEKAPSAGLFEGQTDEGQMGVTYAAIDHFLATGEGEPRDLEIIARYHNGSEHKRRMPMTYAQWQGR